MWRCWYLVPEACSIAGKIPFHKHPRREGWVTTPGGLIYKVATAPPDARNQAIPVSSIAAWLGAGTTKNHPLVVGGNLHLWRLPFLNTRSPRKKDAVTRRPNSRSAWRPGTGRSAYVDDVEGGGGGRMRWLLGMCGFG